jgi:hypothetical protein
MANTNTNTNRPRACACCAATFTLNCRVYMVPAAPGLSRVGVPYGTFCQACWNQKGQP